MRRAFPRCSPFASMVCCLSFALGCSDDGRPADPTSPGDTLPPPADVRIAAQRVFSGFDAPVFLTQAPGDPRMMVVEQRGRVRVVGADGTPESTPYLDVSDDVSTGGERGLLGLAFHPDFVQNGLLFASFTDREGASTIVRYTDPGGGQPVDPQSGVPVYRLTQPFSNHNGGHIAFAPDGTLFLGLGDGGAGGDPLGSGQDRTTHLGSMLRIDVDAPSGGREYGIPADNPFVGEAAIPDEIWAYGLRNPWRFSFDSPTGKLFVADVGQRAREEVNVVDAGSGGYNFGWNIKEGELCFEAPSCDETGLTGPGVTYVNPDEGCAVTGGYVYRGTAIPEVVGTYFYSDFCSGWIRGFRWVDDAAQERATWVAESLGRVTSFGVDGEGELYVLTAEGDIFRLVRA